MYENVDKMKYTPMIRQYLEIKEQVPDTLVFYRLGDFYEMFFNDAIVASRELEIVLTSRDAGTKERIPMCGVPYHSVSSYLDKLTEKGYKIAIVEQVEDPKEAVGIVKREIVKIITPGTVTEGSNLDAKENNYLVSIASEKDRYILSYTDLSTGECFLTNLPKDEDILIAEIIKLNTKEIILSEDFNLDIFKDLNNVRSIIYSIEKNNVILSYLKWLIVNLDKEEASCFSRLINYIVRTQKKTLIHMQKVEVYDSSSYLKIDLSSRRNLELTETLRFQNKKNTLLSIIDKCSTAMGSRFLKKQLTFPLIDKEKIEKRYDVIDKLNKRFLETNDLRKALEEVYDLERIIGKVSYETVNPKDLLQLKRSLSKIPVIKSLVEKIKINEDFDLISNFDIYQEIHKLIDDAIDDDAPFVIKDGGIIKDGYSEELDILRRQNLDSQDYLVNLELRERERTGIKNLKVGYNKVFGYYIEVSKGSAGLVKEEFGYVRKQTLSNSERFIIQELKEKENAILRSEGKSKKLELELFTSLRDKCKDYASILQKLAKTISELDMMNSFQKVANENNYVRPKLVDDYLIELKNSRHPVIEVYNDSFIPNDLKMSETDSILLITGPNMSGKSTYMRQIALISIMAQIGSFVSADSAIIPIFDAIYTRIGAADDIVSGQSTFMVEMDEVNNALSSATMNSLIIFDEIGRGTATYDGLALAQAIIEYIHNNIKCKTLFSTHYHELTSLENDLDNLKNVHVSADDVDGDIVFMHKVLSGAVDKSYGINVARLANIPLDVIIRAEDILNKLESTHNTLDKEILSIKNYQTPLVYDSKSEKEVKALKDLLDIDINNLSPIEALNKLLELQKLLKK